MKYQYDWFSKYGAMAGTGAVLEDENGGNGTHRLRKDKKGFQHPGRSF